MDSTIPVNNTVSLLKNEQDTMSVRAGEYVFHCGDHGDAMFVVLEGVVDILHENKLIEQIRSGGIFGEMSLIDSQPRSADAIARTDCTVARVDEFRFLYLSKLNPYFPLEILRVTVARLRNLMHAASEN